MLLIEVKIRQKLKIQKCVRVISCTFLHHLLDKAGEIPFEGKMTVAYEA